MKTVLSIIGVVALLAVLAMVGGGFYLYKNGGTMALGAEQKAFATFIDNPQNPPQAVRAVRRLVNALTLDPSLTKVGMGGVVLSVINDPKRSSPEAVQMYEDAAALVEQPTPSPEDMQRFIEKYRTLLPQSAPHHP